MRGAISAMRPFRPDTILVVVANPVDLLTSLAQEVSGLPISQVLGSGTLLDSVRLRGLAADKIGVRHYIPRGNLFMLVNLHQVSAKSVDVYVLGVHGDPQIVAWAEATIGGVPICQALPSGADIDYCELEDECKRRSRDIILAKGSTAFGIGAMASRICSSILLDKRTLVPVSHFQPAFRCFFSLPVVLGRDGIANIVQFPLAADEAGKLAKSAEVLKSMLDGIHGDA